MAKQIKEKTGAGLTLGLQILAVLDLFPGVVLVATTLSAGAPGLALTPPEPTFVSTANGLIVLQFLMRSVALVLMSRWTWRLVSNSRKQARFPISSRWAWLGWLTPGVAFVLPVRTLLALNDGLVRITPWRRALILFWWAARLPTCISGGYILIVVVTTHLALTNNLMQRGLSASHVIVACLFWLGVTGIIAKLLEIAVLTLTWRRQPKADDITAAYVF